MGAAAKAAPINDQSPLRHAARIIRSLPMRSSDDAHVQMPESVKALSGWCCRHDVTIRPRFAKLRVTWSRFARYQASGCCLPDGRERRCHNKACRPPAPPARQGRGSPSEFCDTMSINSSAQSTADRLDRQSDIVGNVDACHRQYELLALMAARHSLAALNRRLI